MSESQQTQPPPHLPTDPAAFFRAGADVDLLAVIPPEDAPPRHVLEQLGPPPFRKTTFPMMGVPASFYEHVAAQVVTHPTADEP